MCVCCLQSTHYLSAGRNNTNQHIWAVGMKVSLQFGSCGMMDVCTTPEGRYVEVGGG